MILTMECYLAVLSIVAIVGVVVVRDEHGRVVQGNQLARKYPKPVTDDPAVQEHLAHRREEIVEQKGGDQLSPMQLGDIDRFVILEAFVQSWEAYFLKSSPISRQGRVRSGYKEGYLSSLDRLMKLAQLIGVERVVRDIDTMSIEEYAAMQHEDSDR